MAALALLQPVGDDEVTRQLATTMDHVLDGAAPVVHHLFYDPARPRAAAAAALAAAPAAAEEVAVAHGASVALYTEAGLLRKQYTLGGGAAGAQPAWAAFEGEAGDWLCLVQPRGELALLEARGGEEHLVALPRPATAVVPLAAGALLLGADGAAPLLLSHPLDAPAEVPQLAGEAVLWAGGALVASYSAARARLTMWRVTPRAAPRLTDFDADFDSVAAAGRASPAPALFGGTPGGPAPRSATPGTQRRLSVRLRDDAGRLSPLAFEATPPTGLPPMPAALPLLRGPATLFEAVHEEAMPWRPDSAHLADDADGAPLLCLHSSDGHALAALRIGDADMRAAFTASNVVSVAAVVATRPGLRDLFIVDAGGALDVHVGQEQVCRAGVTAAAASAVIGPAGRVAGAPIARLCNALGSHVTVHFCDGSSTRVTASAWQPAGHLSRAVLNGLRLAMPTGAWHALHAKWLASEAATSGDAELEWRAAHDALLEWWTGEPVSGTAAADGAATDPDAAWEVLCASEDPSERRRLFGWAAEAPQRVVAEPLLHMSAAARKAELLPVLHVLHAVYEDLKLHVLHWRLLPSLGRTLHELASTLGESDYEAFYAHDLAVSCLADVTVPPVGSLAVPSVMRAIDRMLGLQDLGIDGALADERLTHVGRLQCVMRVFAKLYDAGMQAMSVDDFETHERASSIASAKREIAETLASAEWTRPDLETLPAGVAAPIAEILRRCGDLASDGLSSKALLLVGHESSSTSEVDAWQACLPYEIDLLSLGRSEEHAAVDERQKIGPFPDLRLVEVQRLLRSTVAAALRGATSVADAEADDAAELQQRVQAMASRTMALPVGRGALQLGTAEASQTEPLSVPELNLAGRLVERNDAVVALDTTNLAPAPGGGAVAELTGWAEYNNGVAASLRLGTSAGRTWVSYNKPTDPSYSFGGVLLGFGLNGDLVLVVLACCSPLMLVR
jgi:hypothetical protein